MSEAREILQFAHEADSQATRLLTVAEVAQRLRASPQFVRDEIHAQRLRAKCLPRASGRTFIRIPEPAFVEYWQTAWHQRQQST